MRFVGRGHPAVRATHAKTFEFTPDATISARATCVLAVATSVEPAAPLAGPVRLRISAGGERFSVDAMANPSWDPSGPIVIRRGPARRPGTFATEASAGAADLPRPLIAALADPDQLVTVDVAPRTSERVTLVLFAADGPSPALRAELASADLAVALDDGARTLVGRHEARGAGRTVLVATQDLPWRGGRPAERIETVGLAAPLAAAAASPGSAPVVLATGDPRDAIRTTPTGHRLVVSVPAGEVDDLLELARSTRGDAAATVVAPGCPPVSTTAELASRDVVALCLHAVDTDRAVDPAVRGAIGGLLADDVPTRAAARALAALTGWDRRRAYSVVLDWRDG